MNSVNASVSTLYTHNPGKVDHESGLRVKSNQCHSTIELAPESTRQFPLPHVRNSQRSRPRNFSEARFQWPGMSSDFSGCQNDLICFFWRYRCCQIRLFGTHYFGLSRLWHNQVHLSTATKLRQYALLFLGVQDKAKLLPLCCSRNTYALAILWVQMSSWRPASCRCQQEVRHSRRRLSRKDLSWQTM